MRIIEMGKMFNVNPMLTFYDCHTHRNSFNVLSAAKTNEQTTKMYRRMKVRRAIIILTDI